MDGRIALVLALPLTLLACGCVSGPPLHNNPAQAAVKPPEPPPPQVVLEKPKDGPKRQPKPGTVVALAEFREREAEKVEDPGQKMRLRDLARQHYQDALKIDPNYRDAQAGLARVYASLGDFDHAFETYRKALAKAAKDHGMWYDMGMCHNRRKDWNEACKCFQMALELDPENRQYMQTLGFTMARAGQIDQSVAILSRAMGSALAHYNAARMLKHLGQPDVCRQHLQLALQVNPNLDQAREMLASLDSGSGPGRPTLDIEFTNE